jgi:hypothetical protein
MILWARGGFYGQMAVLGQSHLMLLGAGCLVIVVVNQICEAFHLFPVMGWGLKHSLGHYLDLSASILGLVFFPARMFPYIRGEARP